MGRIARWAPFVGGGGLASLQYGWAGATAGAIAAVVHGMRVAGIRTVEDLVARAMLDPEVARILFANVTPRNQDSILRDLGTHLVRAARVGLVAGEREEGRPEPGPGRQRRAEVVPGRVNALLAAPDGVLVAAPERNRLLLAG